MTVPPPAPSPQLPEPSRHDTAEVPVTKGEMKKAFTLNEIWTVIVAFATAGAALIGGYALFIEKAEAAGRKAAESVAEELAKVKADQSETREDMRALYRAVMYRQPQERLERPVAKDAGP
jgi:uncharacterized oligopeptide transporter (OPT) family protein